MLRYNTRAHQYVTLKVFVSNHRQALNERKAYSHLQSIKSNHPSAKGIRQLRDHFRIKGKLGLHDCLTHDPLGVTLSDIQIMSPYNIVKTKLLKGIVKDLLSALDYLHSEAGVVHTGM